MLALTLATQLSLAAELPPEPVDADASLAALVDVAREAAERGDRSLAERTLRHAPCPVLSVKAGGD